MKLLDKKTLQSKTFWLGVMGIIGGIVLLSNGHTKEGIESIVAGLAMITARDAITKAIK